MSFRVEEKLAVNSSQLAGLNKWLSNEGAKLLHPKRKIFSTYFDTQSMDIFTASEEGCVPRKKVRIRTYNSDGHFENENALEVKTSSVEGRHKSIQKLSHNETRQMILNGIIEPNYGVCKPVVSVSYNREYFYVNDVRLTIDTDIEYCATGSSFPVRDDCIAVELKAEFDVSMNMLMQAFPFRRTRFSKYARSIMATKKGACEWI